VLRTETCVRTVLLISAYSRTVSVDEVADELAVLQCRFPNTTILPDDLIDFNLTPCLATTTFIALFHVFLLSLFMLTDLLKAKAPLLRLVLMAILFLEMVAEINARANEAVFLPAEQDEPTGTFLDVLLGDTTQKFVLNLDRSVLALLFSGFATTVLRPESCAFIVLPCRDSTALFFYRQDRRTRRLLGTRRYERLMLWLQLHRNRFKRMIRRRCSCPGASNSDRQSQARSVASSHEGGADASGRI